MGLAEEDPIFWEDCEYITYLDLTDMGITDLSGIECFSNLKYLWCDENDIDSLSLAGLKYLEEVDCSGNDMQYLTLENLPALLTLDCSRNLLTSLDVSDCPALQSLSCQENLLEEVDLFYNEELTYVNVSLNLIPEERDVTLSGQPETFIYLPQALEIDEDISDEFVDTAFRNAVANLMGGEITQRKCQAVTEMDISDMGIVSLTGIDYFENLVKLNVADNYLESLDVSALESLEELDFSSNLIVYIDFGELENLTWVKGDNNELEEVDVSSLASIEWLSLRDNKLSYLDITSNEYLEYLDVSLNYFTTRDNIHRLEDPQEFIYDRQYVDQEDEAPYIELDEDDIDLYVGLSSNYSKAQIYAILYGTTGTIKYKSSNKKVAKVSSDGIITAKKVGSATITAYLEGDEKVMAQCFVNVSNPTIYAPKSVKVKKKKTIYLSAYAYPDVPLTYKSLNKKIATVNSYGEVKGKKKGTTKIQVTVGKVSKKIKVTVY